MRAKLDSGGGLVISMRDFDSALVERASIVPPVLIPGAPHRVLVRLRDWNGDQPCYTVRCLPLTEKHGGAWTVREHMMRHRAITRAELATAAEEAGFRDIAWPATGTIVGDQQVMTALSP